MDVQELFERANDLRNNGETKEAVGAYQRVIGQALTQNNRHLAAEASQMIGSSYYINGQYEEAEGYFLNALDQFKSLNDREGWGAVLRDLGLNAQRQGEYDAAKDYFHNSIYQLKQTGRKGHLGISQVKLGLLYSELVDLERAVSTILEGLGNIVQSPDRFFESTAHFDLAKVYQKMGKTKEAKSVTEKALGILDKISNREKFQHRRKEIEEFLAGLGSN